MSYKLEVIKNGHKTIFVLNSETTRDYYLEEILKEYPNIEYEIIDDN